MEQLLGQSRYACFGGGGAHAISYIGALTYLKRRFPTAFASFLQRLEGAVGTSSGAVTALCVLVNLDPDQMYAECEFLVDANLTAPTFNFKQCFEQYGADDGAALRGVVEKLLALIGLSAHTTFADLYRLTKKRFVCCATIIATNTPFFFSVDRTPHVKLSDALFMSMCIPVLFVPERHDDKLMVDGGLSCNVPHEVFPLAETLIMYMNSPRVQITSLQTYVYALLSCSLATQCRELTKRRDDDEVFRAHSLVISCPASMIEMRVDCESRRAFMNQGYVAMLAVDDPRCVRVVESVLRACITISSRTTTDIPWCSGDDCRCGE